MSTYTQLLRRHRAALRIEKAFIVAVGIISAALVQVVF
jgi:hypothetical protein